MSGWSAVRRIAANRAVQFLVGGALIAALAPKERDTQTVVVSESEVATSIKQETALRGRALTQAEKDAAVSGLVDDVVLAREATRLGLGADDPVTRTLLAQRMRVSLEKAMPTPKIDRAEVDAEIVRQLAQTPQRVRLGVWFVSKERPNAGREAEAIVHDIGALGIAHVRDRDKPPLPSGALWTETELARAGGALVARAAMETEIGKPAGPLASAWGFFVIVPLERRQASSAEVSAAAVAAIIDRKRADDVAKAVSGLRQEYRVEIRSANGEATLDASRTMGEGVN